MIGVKGGKTASDKSVYKKPRQQSKMDANESDNNWNDLFDDRYNVLEDLSNCCSENPLHKNYKMMVGLLHLPLPG